MSKFKNFESLKAIVEFGLDKHPELRDDDKALTIIIWRYLSGKDVIALEEIYKLPSQESIKRIRVSFNQHGMYLSKNKEVLKRRRQQEIEVRKDLGYN